MADGVAEFVDSFSLLVSALSRLQDVTGSKSDLLFPKIIAVGNQSSGKSSVIQGLIGREFLPRGSDIVTRCPLHIRVHQTRDQDQEYVHLPAEKTSTYQIKERTITDFSEVMKEIDKRTAARVGGTKNVSHEEIQLDFYSPKYPDLQFVDLPGFTKTSVGNQDKNIEQQVLDLVLKYMKDPNTIILAINDSTQDIGASEALKYAETFDPEGRRTIGVLTKLDKLEPGSDTARVVNYLENKTKPLAMGYVGVVNRSQQQIDANLDIEAAKKHEAEVLDNTSFRRIRNRMGIDYLRQFLTSQLAQKIRALLPGLRSKTSAELRLIQDQLRDLDESREEAAAKDHEAIFTQLIQAVTEDLRTKLGGHDTKVDTELLDLGALMNQGIKEGTVQSAQQARQTFGVQEFHGRLHRGIENMHAARDPFMTAGLALDIGVGLLVESYRRPFKSLLDNATRSLNEGLQQSLENVLQAYPRLKDLVLETLLEEVDSNKLKTEEYLDILLDIHSKVINTEHEEFVMVNQIMKKSGIRYRNNVTWFKENVGAEQIHDDETDSDYEDDASTSSANLKKVPGFVENIQKSSKSSTPTTRYPTEMTDEATFLLDLCLQYMRIIDRQLVDEIPKYFISMLVHRTLDFLAGGKRHKTSLLAQVKNKLPEVGSLTDVLVKSQLQENLVATLREKERVCLDTLKVIEETFNSLNRAT